LDNLPTKSSTGDFAQVSSLEALGSTDDEFLRLQVFTTKKPIITTIIIFAIPLFIYKTD
jgi:hypothetical protein